MLRGTEVTRRLTVFAETRLRCSRDRAWISGIARLVTTLNFVAETREIKSPLYTDSRKAGSGDATGRQAVWSRTLRLVCGPSYRGRLRREVSTPYVVEIARTPIRAPTGKSS